MSTDRPTDRPTDHYGTRCDVAVPAAKLFPAVDALHPLMGRADLPPRVLYWIARNAAAIEAEAQRVQKALRVALEPFLQRDAAGEVLMHTSGPPGNQRSEPHIEDKAGAQRAQDEVLAETSTLTLYVFDAERLIGEGHQIAPTTWMQLDFMFADADEASQSGGGE